MNKEVFIIPENLYCDWGILSVNERIVGEIHEFNIKLSWNRIDILIEIEIVTDKQINLVKYSRNRPLQRFTIYGWNEKTKEIIEIPECIVNVITFDFEENMPLLIKNIEILSAKGLLIKKGERIPQPTLISFICPKCQTKEKLLIKSPKDYLSHLKEKHQII